MSTVVGVIDIGSNSIKSLAARLTPEGTVVALARESIDVRISRSLWSGGEGRLGAEAIREATEAVGRLHRLLHAAGARTIRAVATSAVRDAADGPTLVAWIRDTTGLEVETITGEAEARWISRGVRCDPRVGAGADILIFDLGGGSLELVHSAPGQREAAGSLPLGAVRVAQLEGVDLSAPLSRESIERITARVSATVGQSAWAEYRLGLKTLVVGTGGTAVTARSVLDGRMPELDQAMATISRRELEALLDRISAQTKAERLSLPGLPTGRADIFPVALAIVLPVLRWLGASEVQPSLYNLRFGIAADLLQPDGKIGR